MPRLSRRARRLSQLTVLLLVAASPLRAQSPVDDGSDARVRFGPIALAAGLAVTTGLDTNVLNEEAGLEQRDLVTRVRPDLDAWLRAGRLRLHSRSQLSSAYYKTLGDQRSFNGGSGVDVAVDLHRFTPFASAAFISTRDRISPEIDGRPLSDEQRWLVGHQLRLSSKTFIDLTHQQTVTTFSDEDTFRGISLRTVLNSRRQRTSAALRILATPVTTAAVAVDVERERFPYAPLRDARTLRVVPTLTFSPFALISGRAAIGFRSFTPDNRQLPPFSGLIMALDLGYTMRGATRLSVRSDRDITYSYDPVHPYYLLNGYQVALTQRLTDTLDASGSYRQQYLHYREASTAAAATVRPDRARTTTLGLSQRLNRRTRIGLTVEHARRASGVVARQYDGLRVNTSIDYRF